LPTHKAQTKKPKELENPTHRKKKKKFGDLEIVLKFVIK